MIDRTDRMRTEVEPPRAGQRGRMPETYTTRRGAPQRGPDAERTLQTIAGGSTTEAIGGIAAVVLAILGLANVMPFFMAAIGAIAVGVALCVEGMAVAARYTQVVELTGGDDRARSELSGGMSTEFLGGAIGIVLAVLALIGIVPQVLLPAAIIVFGVGLLIGTSGVSRLGMLRLMPGVSEEMSRVARERVSGAAGFQAIAGLGAIILGILALIGFAPAVLTLIGILAIGAAAFLSGAAVTSKASSLLQHRYR